MQPRVMRNRCSFRLMRSTALGSLIATTDPELRQVRVRRPEGMDGPDGVCFYVFEMTSLCVAALAVLRSIDRTICHKFHANNGLKSSPLLFPVV